MTFDDFISQRTDKPVDFDGVYPNQCMDLMHQYVYDVLGLTDATTLAQPAAYQVYTNFDSVGGHDSFDRIDNTPDGVPEKGDIVFFGTAIGPYGHVCIFIDGDASSFRSFDANWPTGSLPHIQAHDYTGVLGWLRKKADASDPLTACLAQHDELVTLCNQKDDRITALTQENNTLANTINEKNVEITRLQAQLSTPPQPPAADPTVSNLQGQVIAYRNALQQIYRIVYGKWLIREPIKTVLSKVGAQAQAGARQGTQGV